MMTGWRRILVWVLCAALLETILAPSVHASVGRKAFGLLFLGASGYLAKRAQEYHEDADTSYEEYKVIDPSQGLTAEEAEEEAGRLYKETTREDVKSQISLALSIAFALNGLRLILTGDTRDSEFLDTSHTLEIGVKGDPARGEMRVELLRRF